MDECYTYTYICKGKLYSVIRYICMLHEHWTKVYAFDQCTIYIYVQIFGFSRDLYYCMQIFSGIISISLCSVSLVCIYTLSDTCVYVPINLLEKACQKKTQQNTQGSTKRKYFTDAEMLLCPIFEFWAQNLSYALKNWGFEGSNHNVLRTNNDLGATNWNKFFFSYHLNR